MEWDVFFSCMVSSTALLAGSNPRIGLEDEEVKDTEVARLLEETDNERRGNNNLVLLLLIW